MDLSKFLSKVIGLYEIIISLTLLMNMNQFADSIRSMMNDKPLMLFIGCVTLIIGLLMVVSHNIWRLNWRVLITIVAWIVLLKGISILLIPDLIDQLTMQFVTNLNFAYTISVIELMFGLMLCYFGFRRI